MFKTMMPKKYPVFAGNLSGSLHYKLDDIAEIAIYKEGDATKSFNLPLANF